MLSGRLSNTMATDFCIETVQGATHRYGTQDVFNINQGSQFTKLELGQLLKDNHMLSAWTTSADGMPTSSSNVCGNQSENVYLRAYEIVIATQRDQALSAIYQLCVVLRDGRTLPCRAAWVTIITIMTSFTSLVKPCSEFNIRMGEENIRCVPLRV
jgi:hypothetical protein